MESIQDYISTKEASELYNLSQSQLAHLARTQTVKARKVGHDWLIYSPSLKEYLASNPHPGLKLGTKLNRSKKPT